MFWLFFFSRKSSTNQGKHTGQCLPHKKQVFSRPQAKNKTLPLETKHLLDFLRFLC